MDQTQGFKPVIQPPMDHALGMMPQQEFDTLKSDSNLIKVLGFFWVFAIVVSTFSASINETPTEARVFFGIYAAVLVLPMIGCFLRPSWGRKAGLLMSILILPGVPVGTALGIMGIMTFRRSHKLFGPNRYSHQSILAEHKHRLAVSQTPQ